MKLGKGEELLLELKPHPLAFAHLYLIYTYILAVGIYFWLYPINIEDIVRLPFLSGPQTKMLFLWLILVVPLVVASLIKISWRWAFLSVALAAISTALYYSGHPMWIPEVAVGLIGDLFTDIYRRSHNYYVTSKRIIMEKRFITVNVRELPISKINDVVVDVSLLGRLFNFGTVIPLTASGLGVGQDLALAGTSVKVSRFEVGVAGGRGINVPRARTFLTLYGVPDPENVSATISSLL